MLKENIWVVWSKTSYSGDVTDKQKQGKIELLSQWMLDGWVLLQKLSYKYLKNILTFSNKKELTYIDNLDNLNLGPPAEGHDKGHCSWLRLYGQWSEATVINQDSGKGTYLLVLALSNNTPFQKKQFWPLN